MKVFHTWLAVAVCWSFTAVRANDQTGVPARIDDPRSNTVAWIAADVAVENGQLRPDLLGERLEDLRAIAQRNGRALQDKAVTQTGAERPCSSFKTQSPAEDFDPAETLADLTDYGRAIVSGRVVAIREGFWYGLPASLLEIDGAWLKGQPAGATFFLYPFAHIDTAEGPICSKVAGDAVPPQVGDRVIVFSPAPPFEIEGGRVVSGDFRNRVVYEHRDGGMRVPAALRGSAVNAASAFDDIRKAVQVSVASRPKR